MATIRELLEAKRGGGLRALLERLEAQTKTGVTLRVLPGGLGQPEPAPAAPTAEPEQAVVDFGAPGARVAYDPLKVGETREVNGMRIHRWASSYTVLELANAGKRGKKVRSFGFDVPFSMRRGRDASIEEAFARMVDAICTAKSYDVALGIAKNAAKAAAAADVDMKVWENTERGVDVKPPAGAPGAEIAIDTPTFELRASATDFHVFERRPDHDPDTDNIIPPYWGAKKKAILDFYAWVKANQAEVKKMTFRELGKALADANMAYHRYATLD
jgi:hypothetical protein